MSTQIVKGIAVAAALSFGAMSLATPALAGKSSRNLAIGAAVALGAAAIIAGSQRQHYNGPPPHNGYPPPHNGYPPPQAGYPPPPPPPPPVYRYKPAAWTPAWYQYCSQKFRSFDPRSGTYQPYNGPRRMC